MTWRALHVGPCCTVWEGPGAVLSARKMIGATNPLESEPGTAWQILPVTTSARSLEPLWHRMTRRAMSARP